MYLILSLFFRYVNTQNLTIFDIPAEILKRFKQNIVNKTIIYDN